MESGGRFHTPDSIGRNLVNCCVHATASDSPSKGNAHSDCAGEVNVAVAAGGSFVEPIHAVAKVVEVNATCQCPYAVVGHELERNAGGHADRAEAVKFVVVACRSVAIEIAEAQ